MAWAEAGTRVTEIVLEVWLSARLPPSSSCPCPPPRPPRRPPAPRAFIAVMIKASVLHLLSVSFHATCSFHLHRTLCPPSSPFPWAVECGAQAVSLGYGVSLFWAAGRHPTDRVVVVQAGMGAGTWAQTRVVSTPSCKVSASSSRKWGQSQRGCRERREHVDSPAPGPGTQQVPRGSRGRSGGGGPPSELLGEPLDWTSL